MIRSNAIYLLILFLIFCSWMLALYIRKTDKGDGKRKTIAGWMVFGGLWPIIEKIHKEGVSSREKILIFVGVGFMFFAIIFTLFQTNGTFIWQ